MRSGIKLSSIAPKHYRNSMHTKTSTDRIHRKWALPGLLHAAKYVILGTGPPFKGSTLLILADLLESYGRSTNYKSPWVSLNVNSSCEESAVRFKAFMLTEWQWCIWQLPPSLAQNFPPITVREPTFSLYLEHPRILLQ